MAVSAPTQVVRYDSSASVTTSGAQTVTATVPVGALMYAFVGGASSTTAPTISDSKGHTWTALTLTSNASTNPESARFYWAICTSSLVSGTDTITFGRTGSNSLSGYAAYVTGHDSTTPIGTETTNNSATAAITTFSASAAMTSVAIGDRTVWGICHNSTRTHTAVAGWSGGAEDSNNASTVSNPRSLVILSRAESSAGSVTPGTSWTSGIQGIAGAGFVIKASTATSATVNAVTATESSAAVAPAVSAGSSVTGVKGTASALAPAPVVSAGSTVTAVRGTSTALSPAPVVTASSNVAAVTATATALARPPAVTAGSTVQAVAATATALANPPVVVQQVSATVTAPAATATVAVLAPAVSGYVPIYFFPPVGYESSSDPFFGRYRIEVGYSVLKKNGHYITEPYPWMGDLVGLTEGTDYFLGGRLYIVSADVAAALIADGFEMATDLPDVPDTPTDPPGFGDGGFGEGAFGA